MFQYSGELQIGPGSGKKIALTQAGGEPLVGPWVIFQEWCLEAEVFPKEKGGYCRGHVGYGYFLLLGRAAGLSIYCIGRTE